MWCPESVDGRGDGERPNVDEGRATSATITTNDEPTRAPLPSATLAATHRRAFLAMGTVALLSAAAKGGTVVQEILVARRYGISTVLDAYSVALLLPLTLANVVGGSLAEALVPAQARLRARDDAAGAEAVGRSVAFLTVGLLAVLGLVVALTAPALIRVVGPGFDDDTRHLASRLLALAAVVIPLAGVSLVLGRVLNGRGRYGAAAMAAAAVPFAVAGGILLTPERRSGLVLTFAAVAGYALQLTIIAAAAGRWPRGTRSAAARHQARADRWAVVRSSLPLAAAFLVVGVAPLIDDVMASRLGDGSVATLHLGNRLVSFGISVAALAVGVAVAPLVSDLAARGEVGALRRTVRTWVRLIAIGTIPVTLVLVFASQPIVHLAFERGAFGAADTTAVARVQMLALLQIPPYIVTTLYIRVLAALGASRDFLAVALLSMVANVALDAALGEVMGVAGIALATAVVYTATALVLGGRVRQKLAQRSAQPMSSS
jgi:putative peptidoglycan lipid II flippase